MPISGRHSRHLTKPPPPPVEERRFGPRRERLEQQRKKRRRRESGGLLVAAVVVGALALGLVRTVSTGAGSDPDDRTRSSAAARRADLTTTLVFGTRENGGDVVWLSLVSHNARNDQASVVYIPAHVATEVPGRGLQALGDSYATGGVPLLLTTTQSLLGVGFDRYLELSEQDARVLFDATGPISVDVPVEVRVPAGKQGARVIFEPGRQRLPAEFLVQLLYTVGLEGDDIELGNRHLAFWEGLFDAFASRPAALANALEEAGPALRESDASASRHGEFFARVARVDDDERALDVLPATQVSVGGSELYAVDEGAVRALLGDLLGARLAGVDKIDVQILNGNGVPGVGQKVAERLIGEGFKVIVSGNASRFNHDETLIVVYDDTERGEKIANQAKDLLGVGEVRFSQQSQGIVDLTIVVGKDFLRTL